MFHRRWLDKITLRSWSFLLFVDSLSSWVHSLQTDSYPSGMNAANWAFPFIFQALPGADTIALLSLLIQRVGSYPDKPGAEMKWKAPISADQPALPTALQMLIEARNSLQAGKEGEFSFCGHNKARLILEVTEVAKDKGLGSCFQSWSSPPSQPSVPASPGAGAWNPPAVKRGREYLSNCWVYLCPAAGTKEQGRALRQPGKAMSREGEETRGTESWD